MNSDDTIHFLRGKLIGQPRSEACEHCHESVGHSVRCPLVNREAAEAASRGILAKYEAYSEEDVIRARALGVRL